MARIEEEPGPRILIKYFWKGEHIKKKNAPEFLGFGKMRFECSASHDPAMDGRGDFWEINESRPEATCRKAVEMLRVKSEDSQKMVEKKKSDHTAVVLETLRDWIGEKES
jgi:hypothetical protein